MSTELQKKLNQYEVLPPEACWSQISERLNSEYSTADTVVAEHLADSTAVVPAGAWLGIARVLHADQDVMITPGTSEAPVVPMHNGWLKRIAAVIVLAISVTLLYRYISVPSDGSGEATLPVVSAIPQTGASVVPFAPEPPSQSSVAPPVARVNRTPRVVRRVNPKPSRNNEAVYIAEAASTEMRYANIDNAERPRITHPISVSSEPIRDAEGNIIMDEKLVSAPDNNYVTVTGPNGEQTRMSKKFFRALSYLSADSDDENNMGVMLQESALWKWLFQEWRTRLIQDPTFIPSSTNFLDILQMKDLFNDQL